VTGEALYVYAITDSDLAEAEVAVLRAIDDGFIKVITEAPVAAVVSPVDADKFSASALRENLEDLRWLEGIARAHNAVVSDLARQRPVAPVRLATVFVSDDNVREMLRTRAQDFAGALDRVRGRCEWALKGFLITGPVTAKPSGSTESSSPGRSYLERRRAERESRNLQLESVLAEVETLHQRLDSLSLASKRYPLQDRRLTGYRDEMVLNAAYLLPEGEPTELRRAVDSGQSQHLRLELVGPWAPYSFATLE
jgi:Gas vesicle synthesis protein GvpL/GvpF